MITALTICPIACLDRHGTDMAAWHLTTMHQLADYPLSPRLKMVASVVEPAYRGTGTIAISRQRLFEARRT
jgi:hypothetical protein